MLFDILWQWGTKYVDTTLDEEEELRAYSPVRATEFDPDFDLDCLIWNTIIKRRLDSIEGNLLTVTADKLREGSSHSKREPPQSSLLQESS